MSYLPLLNIGKLVRILLLLCLLFPGLLCAAPKFIAFPFFNVDVEQDLNWLSISTQTAINADLTYLSAIDAKGFHHVELWLSDQCPGLEINCVAQLPAKRWQKIAKQTKLDGYIHGHYRRVDDQLNITLQLYSPTSSTTPGSTVEFNTSQDDFIKNTSLHVIKLFTNHGVTISAKEKQRILAPKTHSLSLWRQYSQAMWLGYQSYFANGTKPMNLSFVQKLQLSDNSEIFSRDLISINFENIPLKDLLELFSEYKGDHFQISRDVPPNVQNSRFKLNLKNKPWDQILWLVLDSKNLSLQQKLIDLPLTMVDSQTNIKNAIVQQRLKQENISQYAIPFSINKRNYHLGYVLQKLQLLQNIVKQDLRFAEAQTALIATRLQFSHAAKKGLDFQLPLSIKPWLIKANLYQAYVSGQNKYIHEAIRINPSNLELQMHFAHYLLQQQKTSDARSQIEKILALNPHNYEFQTLHCLTYLNSKHSQQLEKCSKKLLQQAGPYRSILLEKLPSIPEAMFPVLVKNIHSQDQRLKIASIIALSNSQFSKKTTTLLKASNDSHPMVRAAAIKGLNGSDNPPVVKRLVTLLQDPNSLVRLYSLQALHKIHYSSALPAVINMMAQDTSHLLRDAARNILNKTPSQILAKHVIDILPLIENKKPEIKELGLWLTKKIVYDKHLDALEPIASYLINLLNDRYQTIPDELFNDLKSLAETIIHQTALSPSKTNVYILAGFLKIGDVSMLEHTIDALQTSATQEVVPHLTRFVSENKNEFLLLSASHILVKLQASQAIPKLLKFADLQAFQDKHFLRKELAQALAQFRSERAKKLVRRGLKNSSKNIRQLSADVLLIMEKNQSSYKKVDI